MNPEYFMQIALEEAKKGDAPYGAVIVKHQEVVAVAHNTVKGNSDPSAHAEINVIRSLTAKLKSPSLEGYSIYIAIPGHLAVSEAVLQSNLINLKLHLVICLLKLSSFAAIASPSV